MENERERKRAHLYYGISRLRPTRATLRAREREKSDGHGSSRPQARWPSAGPRSLSAAEALLQSQSDSCLAVVLSSDRLEHPQHRLTPHACFAPTTVSFAMVSTRVRFSSTHRRLPTDDIRGIGGQDGKNPKSQSNHEPRASTSKVPMKGANHRAPSRAALSVPPKKSFNPLSSRLLLRRAGTPWFPERPSWQGNLALRISAGDASLRPSPEKHQEEPYQRSRASENQHPGLAERSSAAFALRTDAVSPSLFALRSARRPRTKPRHLDEVSITS